MIDNKGSPAFSDSLGLTKREYFTAMALQGLLANESVAMKSESPDGPCVQIYTDLVADAAISAADAVLKRL